MIPPRFYKEGTCEQNGVINSIITGTRKLKPYLSRMGPNWPHPKLAYHANLTPSEILALYLAGADISPYELDYAAINKKKGLSNPFYISLVPRPNSLLSTLLEQHSSPYGATNQP